MVQKNTQSKIRPGKSTLLALAFSAIASVPPILGIMTILFNTPSFRSEGGGFDIFFIPFAASVIALPVGIANIIYGIKNRKKLTKQHKILIALVGLFTLLVAYWWFTIVYTLFMMPTHITTQ
jgi:hypothetical protein